MIQENKELLLKDLCTRLPHGIKCKVWYNDKTLNIKCTGIDFYTNAVNLDVPEDDNAKVYVDNVKPYLFPLSSMTEEQKKEYHSIIYRSVELHYNEYCDVIDIDFFDVLQEFYLKNHFDYRGLIPMDLAIDCTDLNVY